MSISEVGRHKGLKKNLSFLSYVYEQLISKKMLCFGFLELNDHNLNEYKLCAVKKKSGITKTNSLILIDFKFVKINPQSTCFHTFVDVESLNHESNVGHIS